MAVPSAYNEAELMAYMRTVLGATATVLGWDDLAPYQEPVNETLLAYGVVDIAQATDVQKLRALARVAVWQRVVDVTAGRYDISTDGQSLSRSQMHKHARESLRAAKHAAMRDDDAYAVVMTSVRYTSDPYRTFEEDDDDA